MQKDFAAAMLRATLLTRGRKLMEATRVIQAALTGRRTATAGKSASPPQPEQRLSPRLNEARPPAAANPQPAGHGPQPSKPRRPLGEVLEALRRGRPRIDALLRTPVHKPPHAPAIPEGAQWLTRSFSCAAGTRGYRLYIPASARRRPAGLIVMLHGCKQDPEDFAIGTDMNAVAESRGLLVAYPEQIRSANPSSCWNWFNPGDQQRDMGEPSIIAGLTRDIIAEYGVAKGRVFIAGLSAGGAMAAVLGETYPDLYAAVGVHSGLAAGSARDLVSAFAAMRGEDGGFERMPGGNGRAPRPRTIVFHGSADPVVAPVNAERVVAAASGPAKANTVRQEQPRSASGRTVTRNIVAGADGRAIVEFWLIDKGGHAWSGGNSGGSFVDPEGPSASREMVRFFLNEAA
jgi:poly(hydroxyalkanoate) depolymerase family esterase